MEDGRIRGLLNDWHAFVDASETARRSAGISGAVSPRPPIPWLAAALVAEITSGTVDPWPMLFGGVLTADGRMIGIFTVDTGDDLRMRGAVSIEYATKMLDETAIVALSNMRPYAVHFISSERLRAVSECFGVEGSSWPPAQGFAHDIYLLSDLELDPVVAAVMGVRTVMLEPLEAELGAGAALDRARLVYSSGCLPSNDATKVALRVMQLEKEGLFRWIDFAPPYDNMAATLLETVLIEGRRYGDEVSPAVHAVRSRYEELQTSELLVELESGTSSWPEPFRLLDYERERVKRAARVLAALRVETEAELRTRLAGVGTGLDCTIMDVSGRELAYLQMLSGATHRSAGGCRIRRFLESVGVHDVDTLDDADVEAIVVEAAVGLGRTTRELDHSIWAHVGVVMLDDNPDARSI